VDGAGEAGGRRVRAAGPKRGRPRRPWRIVPHTADLGLAVRGRTLGDLFENAGRALCALASGGGHDIRPRRTVRIAVRGSALDDLLVRWLQELLFLQETRRWRFRGCAVDTLDRRRLSVRGQAVGEPFDPARHPRRREIKAVTYHGLRIVRRAGSWRVRIILDV
jgi:protein archease